MKTDPRQRTRANQVRPEASRTPRVEPPCEHHSSAHEDRKLDQAHGPRWIERRNDEQSERVVGDREEQEKRDDRVPLAEDDARGKVTEGDVGSRGIAHPRSRFGRSNTIVSTTKIKAGPNMPPTAAASGMAPRRG